MFGMERVVPLSPPSPTGYPTILRVLAEICHLNLGTAAGKYVFVQCISTSKH